MKSILRPVLVLTAVISLTMTLPAFAEEQAEPDLAADGATTSPPAMIQAGRHLLLPFRLHLRFLLHRALRGRGDLLGHGGGDTHQRRPLHRLRRLLPDLPARSPSLEAGPERVIAGPPPS